MASARVVGMAWEDDLVCLVTNTGILYWYPTVGDRPAPAKEAMELGDAVGKAFGVFEGGHRAAEESFKDHMKGFLKASGELLLELGKSSWDITQQSPGGRRTPSW
ncbi:hypothetical protein Taro_002151 [Colocasia esculenta]|uniref:Uncharacterized protein n=1 Tax=Colocasia esculenta TaxID=4460 RepID=A0A843TMV8_COLES|nr:hypothetical protein [Colocasia esculenta]